MLPISVLLGLILYGVALARNGDLAEVAISDREIVIRPRGVFKFLSFRWSVRIPAESVAGASVIDTGNVDPPGMRYAATLFPGLVAGTFTGQEGMSYWLSGRRGAALQVNVSDGPLTRVVVQVSDPDAIAQRIRNLARAG
ncbi:hypothetical protein AB0O34_23920 [Sphaerisporangium sp. NPDC088356]|uniref:hypothetical protein n=1 Tax=Sphaerisporangium sp. NPDC088356 TaxID=3154871 RepID=UPI0034194BE9